MRIITTVILCLFNISSFCQNEELLATNYLNALKQKDFNQLILKGYLPDYGVIYAQLKQEDSATVISNLDSLKIGVKIKVLDSLIESDFVNVYKAGEQLGLSWEAVKFIKSKKLIYSESKYDLIVFFEDRGSKYAIRLDIKKIGGTDKIMFRKTVGDEIWIKKVRKIKSFHWDTLPKK